jgi:hypothetical protein
MQTVEGAKRAAATRHARKINADWEEIQAFKKMHGSKCTCKLRKGMTWDDLRKVENCCRDLAHSYICPVLDRYRRLVGYPKLEDDDG